MHKTNPRSGWNFLYPAVKLRAVIFSVKIYERDIVTS